jgi:hypothetical protein
MKPLQILSTIVLLSLTNPLFSQSDNENSVIGEIFKNRLELKEKFMARDMQAVNRLYDQLVSQTKRGSFSALNLQERLLILVWTERYSDITTLALAIPETTHEEFPLKLSVNDFLFETLTEHTIREISEIDEKIAESELNAEEKSFVAIAYKWAITDKKNPGLNQDALNDLCKKYLDEYPRGTYANIIKQAFYIKESTGDYGYSTMFGGGMNISGKEYSDYFYSPALLGFDFDYHIRSWAYGLSATTYITETNRDIILDDTTTWKSNSAANQVLISLNAAYKPIQKERVMLLVRGGYQHGWILPVVKNTAEEPVLSNYTVKVQGIRLSAALSYVFKQRIISTNYMSRKNVVKYGVQVQYSLGMNRYSHLIDNVCLNHSVSVGLYLGGFNVRD